MADATADTPRRPTTDDVTDLIERIVLGGVGLTSRALVHALPGTDLTFPQWRVLVVLGDEPEGATVSTVADRVGVTVPATGRQLRRLEQRGLVWTAPDETDRRAVRAGLSAAGLAARDAILGYRRERIAAGAAGVRLSDTALGELARIAGTLDKYR
ncbi:MAG: MarR family transcriptional regulator [Chloroflexota bacterium]